MAREMDVVEVTVADLEAMIDRLALSRHWIGESPVYEEVATKLDGPTGDQFRPLLLRCLQRIFELRVADQQGFDLTCVKMLCPEMTHDDLAQAMTLMGYTGYSHRARSSERLKRFSERFPMFQSLLNFDARGGDRDKHGVVSGEKLLADYEAMRAEEMAKPPPERLRAKGQNGIYHKLACRYGIRGLDGKPSWCEVEKRLTRHKKKRPKRHRNGGQCPPKRRGVGNARHAATL